jgi:hypothetical protein
MHTYTAHTCNQPYTLALSLACSLTRTHAHKHTHSLSPSIAPSHTRARPAAPADDRRQQQQRQQQQRCSAHPLRDMFVSVRMRAHNAAPRRSLFTLGQCALSATTPSDSSNTITNRRPPLSPSLPKTRARSRTCVPSSRPRALQQLEKNAGQAFYPLANLPAPHQSVLLCRSAFVHALLSPIAPPAQRDLALGAGRPPHRRGTLAFPSAPRHSVDSASELRVPPPPARSTPSAVARFPSRRSALAYLCARPSASPAHPQRHTHTHTHTRSTRSARLLPHCVDNFDLL